MKQHYTALLITCILLVVVACNKRSDTIYFNDPVTINDTIDNGDTNGTNDTIPTGTYVNTRCSEAIDAALTIADTSITQVIYQEVLNRVVALSLDERAMVLINLNNGNQTSISLNKKPTCYSLSPTGNSAVVGHDGMFSVVNLSSNTVTKEVAVDFNVEAILLSSTGWAYAFSSQNNRDFHCIHIASELDTIVPIVGYMSYPTAAVLAADQKAIYFTDAESTLQDIFKYDISNDTAKYVYKSNSTSSQYRFGGGLWINDAENHLFTRNGTVIRANDDPQSDLRYTAQLKELNSQERFSHYSSNQNADRLVALTSTMRYFPYYDYVVDSAYYVYDGTYFELLAEREMPYVNHEGVCYRFEPDGGFFTSSGNAFYLAGTIQAVNNPNNRSWAIVPIDLDD
jgi:hypothetical protein